MQQRYSKHGSPLGDSNKAKRVLTDKSNSHQPTACHKPLIRDHLIRLVTPCMLVIDVALATPNHVYITQYSVNEEPG